MSFPEKKFKEEKARRNLLKEINKVSVLEPDEKEFWARWGYAQAERELKGGLNEEYRMGYSSGKRDALIDFKALLAEQRKQLNERLLILIKWENDSKRKNRKSDAVCYSLMADEIRFALGVLEEKLK